MAKNPADKDQKMQAIVSLCRRRAFVFQSSEIYGGLNGCWDYGPLGVELLRNIKEAWWRAMTWRDDIEGIDAAILMHPRVWEASGHIQSFSDPLIDCRSCKSRYRVDTFFEELPAKRKKELLKGFIDSSAGDDDLHQVYTTIGIGAGDNLEPERREHEPEQARKDELHRVIRELDD